MDLFKFVILFFICGLISWLVVKHTGTGDGQLKPETVWAALIAIFATKIVDFIFAGTKKRSVGKKEGKRKAGDAEK